MENLPNNDYLDQSNFSCVFCLSSGVRDDIRLHGDSDSGSSEIKSPWVTLRNMCRYLQLLIPPDTSSSSSWYICEKCSKLAVEFNDLYHLGEEIKLRLNWCLQKFSDVMTTQNPRNENQSEKENDYGDLGNFRAAMRSRTKEIILFPRVALSKIEIPERLLLSLEGSPSNEMDLHAESDENIEILSPARIEIGMKMECDDPTDLKTSHNVNQNSVRAEAYSKKLQQKARCHVDVAKEKQLPLPNFHGKTSHLDFASSFIVRTITSSSASSKNRFKCKSCDVSLADRHSAHRHWKYYCKKGKKQPVPKLGTLTCQYCNFECVNRGLGAGGRYMNRHLIRMHPSHFFPHESKESSLPVSEFDSIIRRDLFPQFSLKDGNGGIGTSSCSCSLCGVKYKRSHDQPLKLHLISRHKQQLRDSLRKILKEKEANASLEEKLRRKVIAPEVEANMNRATGMKREGEYIIVPNDIDPLAM